jgi:hypothetical protein
MVCMYHSCLSTYIVQKFSFFPLWGIISKFDFNSHGNVFVGKKFLISEIITQSVIAISYIIGSFCPIFFHRGFTILYFFQEHTSYHIYLHNSFCLMLFFNLSCSNKYILISLWS